MTLEKLGNKQAHDSENHCSTDSIEMVSFFSQTDSLDKLDSRSSDSFSRVQPEVSKLVKNFMRRREKKEHEKAVEQL